jgi:hypothetical protein
VTVRVAVKSAAGVHTPAFTVCPVAKGTACSVGSIAVGQADELQVSVRVGKQAAMGEQVQLTARASATKALSYTDSAADVVAARPAASPTTTTPAGGVTLPPVTLPPLSGTGVSASDPSGLFPTVGPAPSPSTSAPLGLPPVKPHKTIRVADAAATVPLDSRLIGGQLAGLAVLIGAVVLAIARLSLRTPKPAEDKSAAKPPAS